VSATLHTPRSTPLQIARDLAETCSRSVVERDRKGGTPKAERDALRASGLLALSIPREFGGLNATWSQTFDVVREFARVDSSIAHVFGFHHLMLATVRLFGAPSQWQPWYELTARKNWFWGNALNPLDTRTIVKHHGSWREFSGKKSFCSGASDSQMLIASAVDEAAGGKLLIAAIPSGRTGITLHDDWHNMGQRQTDSGSATFERVRVEEGDLLLDPGPLSTPFACLRPLIAQLHFANICLGIAEGAFEEARQYTLNETRPWFKSTALDSRDDPYVLGHFGDFWVRLQGARLLLDNAAGELDRAWAKGAALGADQRGRVAVAIATAKVAASRDGLELCSKVFEVTGARATQASVGLDRHWRNLRTQSLHDPLDYKLHELGDWALNQRLPIPTFYS